MQKSAAIVVKDVQITILMARCGEPAIRALKLVSDNKLVDLR